MKKIVILSERLPFPPTSGTKNLMFNYCKILHEKLGLEVVNLSFMENEDDISLKPDFISKVYELPNPSGKAKVKNLLLKTLIQQKYPIQVSLFWDKRIKEKIDSILAIEKPDYVIADLIRTTEYLNDFAGFKIADLQDLFSLRYERQLRMDLATLNPYGAYLYRLPVVIQKTLSITSIKKLVMRTEIKLLKKYEKQVGQRYDRIMFVAKNEGEKYNHMLGEKKAIVAPLGVDYEHFSEELHVNKIPHSIAFMGALNVAHNENGIIYFAKNIFPLIQEKIPEVKLYIIGGGATEAIKNLTSRHIVLTGRVEDVRVAVSSCETFICPLRFGSGIKTKNLEAMAMGVPIVTTSIGAENIDADDGKEWFVADDNETFANQVIALLEDSELRQLFGENGRDFVKKNFSWKVAEEQFRELL